MHMPDRDLGLRKSSNGPRARQYPVFFLPQFFACLPVISLFPGHVLVEPNKIRTHRILAHAVHVLSGTITYATIPTSIVPNDSSRKMECHGFTGKEC